MPTAPTSPVDTDADTDRKTKTIRYLAALACTFVVVNAVGLFVGVWHGFVDLRVYRAGARTFLNGLSLYDTTTLIDGPDGLPFTYPPTAALAFTPFGLVSPMAAQGIIFAITLASLAAVFAIVLTRLRPELDTLTKVAVIGTLVFLFEFVEPVRTTLGFGQINVVLMLAVVLDTLTRARYWPRGMLIGIAVAIKLTPAVFLLYFLLRKDWRAAITMTVSTLATVGFGWLILPADSAQYWLRTLWDTDRIGAPSFANNQSFKGMLTRLPLPDLWQSGLWLALCGAALVLAVIWMRRLLATGDVLGALLVNALLILFVSPVSWTHHWVWVAPAFLVAAHALASQPRDKRKLSAFGVVFVIFSIGPTWLLPRTKDRELGWGWWQHLIGNSYLIVGLSVLILGVIYSRPQPPTRRDEKQQDATATAAPSGTGLPVH